MAAGASAAARAAAYQEYVYAIANSLKVLRSIVLDETCDGALLLGEF
jgi:hypothetical protein